MFSNYSQINKSPRKKRRKHSVDNLNGNISPSGLSQNVSTTQQNQNQTTINIIDRVLDLSKYDKDTGLYTLTRDWMNATTLVNDSKLLKKEFVQNDEPIRNENSYYINKLPEPNKDQETMSIDELNQDIKRNIKSSEKSDLDLIDSLNVDEFMQTHALLKLHVNRWKQTRKKWLNYYSDSNRPYKNSYDCLKSIFEEFQ
ncbi:unnamed protein product [Brachionus calyciflorus]|uniref:Uncharacterized protein n=1 Tax=Brachionus calyciflorus TaxID=104777 RepID=A0A813VN59_9BILA|nr:unnamed protein product [Brachionus calyciflorus]